MKIYALPVENVSRVAVLLVMAPYICRFVMIAVRTVMSVPSAETVLHKHSGAFRPTAPICYVAKKVY